MLVLWLMVIICVLLLFLIGFAKGMTIPKWGEAFVGIVERVDDFWDDTEDWIEEKLYEVKEWSLFRKRTRCKH